MGLVPWEAGAVGCPAALQRAVEVEGSLPLKVPLLARHVIPVMKSVEILTAEVVVVNGEGEVVGMAVDLMVVVAAVAVAGEASV